MSFEEVHILDLQEDCRYDDMLVLVVCDVRAEALCDHDTEYCAAFVG